MARKRKTYRKRRNRLSGKVVTLHRMLIEEQTGRALLPGEIVHHREGDSTNNDLSNLVVLPSQAYHAHIEAILRRQRSGQDHLFPELLQGLRENRPGTLFEFLPTIESRQ